MVVRSVGIHNNSYCTSDTIIDVQLCTTLSSKEDQHNCLIALQQKEAGYNSFLSNYFGFIFLIVFGILLYLVISKVFDWTDK